MLVLVAVSCTLTPTLVFAQIVFPTIVVPAALPWVFTPTSPPAMRLPSPGLAPPTVLFVAPVPTSTLSPPLPITVVPSTATPI